MSFVFSIDGNTVECTVTKTHLTICNADKKESIKISDIIAVEEALNTDKQNAGINVFKIEHADDFNLRNKKLTLTGDKEICRQFRETVQSKIDEFKERPKRLLVLISRIAGKQRGEQTYKDVVAPIFHQAGIQTEIMVSDYPDHIKDFMKTYDLEKVDGFVVCGGDSSYNQCFVPLLERTQQKAGINHDSSTAELTPTAKPIGFIPTGTGCADAKIIYGCTDVETATLHIVKGFTSRLGVTGVYSENKYVGFLSICFGFGLFTEIFYCSERFRWLKTLRYLFVMIYYMLLKPIPEFKAHIKLLPRANSEADASSSEFADEERLIDTIYFPIKFFEPDVHNVSTTWNPNNSYLRLLKNTYSSRFQLLANLLMQWFHVKKNIKPNYRREFHEIDGFRFQLDTSVTHQTRTTYRLLLDGEYVELTSPEWEVRNKGQVLTVYSSLLTKD